MPRRFAYRRSRPVRKNYTRRVARYGRARRYRRKPGSQVVAFQKTVLSPDRQYVKLRGTVAAPIYRGNNGATFAMWAYRMNCLNDWVGTSNDGTFSSWTSSPIPGFDAYSMLYGQYKVMGCKWEIQMVPNTTTGHQVTVVPMAELPLTATEILVDRRRAQTKLQGTGSSPTIRFRGYNRIGQLYGDENAVKVQAGFQASTTSDPGEKVFLVVQVQNSGTGNQIASEFAVMVRLTFYTVFFEPLDVET